MIEIFHFIWFGSDIPSKYRNQLLSFRQHNPTYTLKLWTDFDTLSDFDKPLMIGFCNQHDVELINIRDAKLVNSDLIFRELDRSKTDRPIMKRIHYVRASDLARVAILFLQGGLYFDTDVFCKDVIPDDMTLSYGFLSQLTFEQKYLRKRDFVKQVFYHFMAALPGNFILKLALDISRLDYQTYDASTNKLWEQSDERTAQMFATIRLTGTSLKWAINYLIIKGDISRENSEELFYDTEIFAEASSDQSWLVDFQVAHASDEQITTSLDAFLEEIGQERWKVYPLAALLSEPDYQEFLPEFDRIPLSEIHNLFINSNPPSYQLRTDEPLVLPPISMPGLHLSLPSFTIEPWKVKAFELSDLAYDGLQVMLLKGIIETTADSYINHSKKQCRFSIFHRHGKEGRDRVSQWLESLDDITNLSALRLNVITYLKDDNNGKTNLHSFRMMLVMKLTFQDLAGYCMDFDQLVSQLCENWQLANNPVISNGNAKGTSF